MKETENIKDPNQLDLFAGIVLTVEQQKQVGNNPSIKIKINK